MAFCEPSGCGIAPLPMKSPSLMSASVALLTSTTIVLSARLIFSSSPLSDFAITVLPSTFSMVPRRRTVCGACAKADAAIKEPTTASSAVFRVVRMGCPAAASYIGGAAPSRPTLIAGAVIDPSGCFWPWRTATCAPTLRSSACARHEFHDGVFGGTMIFFSPSEYFTISVWPSTPATVD